MEIIFIKQLTATGTASTATITMERELRAKGFWGTLTATQDSPLTPEFAGPSLLVKHQGSSEYFSDVASFQKHLDLASDALMQPQAACW